jgi:hypothetical protein
MLGSNILRFERPPPNANLLRPVRGICRICFVTSPVSCSRARCRPSRCLPHDPCSLRLRDDLWPLTGADVARTDGHFRFLIQ